MAIQSTDKGNINAMAGGLCHDTDRMMLRIQQFKVWLDTITDANLISLYGYVQADIDILRSAIGDLDQLRAIYQGAATLGTAKDFRTFTKLTYPFGSIV